MNYKTIRIVLTGGPCSWKSAAIEHVRTTFANKGFFVVTVPESASYLMNDMWLKREMETISTPEFQDMVVKTQLSQEDIAQRMVESVRRNSLIILDRWILDSKAYISQEEMDFILRKHNLEETDVLQNRYDGVIHLQTVADGAEEHYTCSNNPARAGTTLDRARELGIGIKNAYNGARRRCFIGNFDNFSEKVSKVEEAISQILN